MGDISPRCTRDVPPPCRRPRCDVSRNFWGCLPCCRRGRRMLVSGVTTQWSRAFNGIDPHDLHFWDRQVPALLRITRVIYMVILNKTQKKRSPWLTWTLKDAVDWCRLVIIGDASNLTISWAFSEGVSPCRAKIVCVIWRRFILWYTYIDVY